MYFNNFSDSPFIRSEIIEFRETGVMAQWDPEPLVFTVAITNGGFNADTNSSKALIAHGVDRAHYAYGVSAKVQDGVGSNGLGWVGSQKEFDSFYGYDAMCRWGNWTLSTEGIYDQYGFRRPGFDPDDIFWARSIYFRDLSRGVTKPLTGIGLLRQLALFRGSLAADGQLWRLFQLAAAGHPSPRRAGASAADEGQLSLLAETGSLRHLAARKLRPLALRQPGPQRFGDRRRLAVHALANNPVRGAAFRHFRIPPPLLTYRPGRALPRTDLLATTRWQLSHETQFHTTPFEVVPLVCLHTFAMTRPTRHARPLRARRSIAASCRRRPHSR